MNYSEIFEAEGDDSQDDGTLFSLSDEFLEAARVLQETPPIRVGYRSATYYLLGHSAELILKAFLFKHGLSVKELRKINPDLGRLASLAREKGLPERIGLTHVLHLAVPYRDKGFEYRARKKLTFPPIDQLTQEVKALQSAVFDKPWECKT